MNPKTTPEIETALKLTPVGPIRLDSAPGSEPVYLIRLDDIAGLQELVETRLQEKLSEANADIEANRIDDWDLQLIKQSARNQLDLQHD